MKKTEHEAILYVRSGVRRLLSVRCNEGECLVGG